MNKETYLRLPNITVGELQDVVNYLEENNIKYVEYYENEHKLEQALDEIEKYLKSNIESCNSALSNPEYTIISKHELLKNEKQKDIDILKIIQKAKGDGK